MVVEEAELPQQGGHGQRRFPAQSADSWRLTGKYLVAIEFCEFKSRYKSTMTKFPNYFLIFCELEMYCCSSLHGLLQVTKSTQGPTVTNAQQETLPILDTLHVL